MVRAKVRGMSQMIEALNAFGRKATAQKVLAKSIRPSASDMRDAVRSLAPEDTGEYLRTIKTKRQGRQEPGTAKYTIRSRGRKAPLSHLLEFGTSKMIAHPHFEPAFNALAAGVPAVFVREYWPQLAREVKFQAARTLKKAGKK
jgi:HK97 gp10 family phage protein